MTTLFGISNCDSVKKARRWLDSHEIDYRFHDFRKDGLSQSEVQHWLKTSHWETLLNKRGTTWRQLPAEQKETVNGANIIALLVKHPTLIKRPVLTRDNAILVGFDTTDYCTFFSL